MKKLVIIIPIYKTNLDKEEIISLHSLKKGSLDYDIKIIGGKNQRKSHPIITQYLPSYDVSFEEFDAEYFISKQSYSRLLLSKEFYSRFEQFKYIMIFQLDSLWIGGDLNVLLKEEIHYLGAPWIKETVHTKRLLIGNGGFSLRRTSSFIRWLERDCILPSKKWKIYLNSSVLYAVFYFFLIVFYSIKQGRISKESIILEYGMLIGQAEDVIISRYMKQRGLQNLGIEEALKFSFESDPEKCFELSNRVLPLGSHGWSKYNLNFWIKEVNWLEGLMHQV